MRKSYNTSFSGHTMRTLRERRGITRDELARRSGLSKGYLANLENGFACNPTLGALERIAEALGGRLVIVVEGS